MKIEEAELDAEYFRELGWDVWVKKDPIGAVLNARASSIGMLAIGFSRKDMEEQIVAGKIAKIEKI